MVSSRGVADKRTKIKLHLNQRYIYLESKGRIFILDFVRNISGIHKKVGPAPAGQKIRDISLNDRMSLKYGKYPSQIFHSCVT